MAKRKHESEYCVEFSSGAKWHGKELVCFLCISVT